MGKYAQATAVSPDNTITEIRSVLKRYGAERIGFIEETAGFAVAFEMRNRKLRFTVKLPAFSEFERTPQRRMVRSKADQLKVHDQAIRQRFRALLLVIKAKMEAVESGIETFDEAFMAHLLLANGRTMGEWYGPQIEQQYLDGISPMLLPASISGDNHA